MPSVRSLLLLALCVGALLASALPADAVVCTAPPKLAQGEKVYVGIFVWLIGQPPGLYTGRIADTTATLLPGYGTALAQPTQIGIDLYVKMMRDRGGVLPLPSGINVTVEYVYINLATIPLGYGPADTLPNGYPLAMALGTFPPADIDKLMPGYGFLSAAFPGNEAFNLPPGLYHLATSTNVTILQQHFGISQPFTYLVPAVLTLEDGIAGLANLVEPTQSHAIMVPFIISQETLVCSSAPNRTKDCEGAPYNRNRRPGARRFETVFSTLTDSTPTQSAALDSFHTLGIKSVVIINTWSESFTGTAATYTAEAAEQLNIKVVKRFPMAPGSCDYYHLTTGVVNRGCPPPLINGQNHSQVQLFPNDETPFEVAAFMAANAVDALIIIGEPATAGAYNLAKMFDGFRHFGYTPKAISVSGSVDRELVPYLTVPTDIFGVWTLKPWDPRLVGTKYRNELTPTQFELLPTIGNVYGPRAFQNAYEAEYGPTAHWGAGGAVGKHPMYDTVLNDPSMAAVGWAVMMQIQKLIEFSESLDVPSILVAALKVSAPSAYQPVQFDRYGRTAYVNEILVQQTGGEPLLLAPYNIGVPPIFPLPTWSEREFDPQWYSETGEKALVAVTAVCIGLCLLLVAFVISNWKSAVIRAATPTFCLVIIAGAILMLTSNFFSTLVVNGAHCAASVWLLTTGFTCIFASLFIKTFRIWRIFQAQKLQVVKMKDRDLLVALSVFLLMDVLINAVWQGAAGMDSARVTVDPLRPSYDYLRCDFDDALPAIYAHLVVKGLMLLIGITLTWAVRHVPSQFNEATLIALSIYNTSFVVCFIVPIIAVGLGGRNTTYLIRGFAVIFVAMSTAMLLFLPKLINIMNGSRVDMAGGTRIHGDGGKTKEDNNATSSYPTGGGNVSPAPVPEGSNEGQRGAGRSGRSLASPKAHNPNSPSVGGGGRSGNGTVTGGTTGTPKSTHFVVEVNPEGQPAAAWPSAVSGGAVSAGGAASSQQTTAMESPAVEMAEQPSQRYMVPNEVAPNSQAE